MSYQWVKTNGCFMSVILDLFSQLLGELNHKGNYLLVYIHAILKYPVKIGAGNYKQISVYHLIKTQIFDGVYAIAKIRLRVVQF
jgi:hypothetical protein